MDSSGIRRRSSVSCARSRSAGSSASSPLHHLVAVMVTHFDAPVFLDRLVHLHLRLEHVLFSVETLTKVPFVAAML